MRTKKINSKKLNLKKETISNLENVKAGLAVVVQPADLVQLTNTNEFSRCDTCLCAPTFWDGCQAQMAIAVPDKPTGDTCLCAPTFWDGCLDNVVD